MALFGAELYKILRRRQLLGGLAVLFLAVGMWFMASTVWEEDAVVDGVRYQRMEAIRKNREIGRQWEGVLTIEKLYAVLDTYGMALNEGKEVYTPRGGNWVSRYATEQLTDYRQREDHTGAVLKSQTELDTLERKLKRYQPYFCYMENVDWVYEMCMFMNLVLVFVIVLGVTPVFAEEYQCRSAAMVRSCERGRGKTMAAKTAAALAFGLGVYVLANGMVWGAYCLLYGTDGLSAGAVLSDWVAYPVYQEGQVWQAFGWNFLWGMLGIVLAVATTLLFSVAFRQGFLVLGASFAYLVGGRLLPDILAGFLPRHFIRLLCWIFESNPIYLLSLVSQGSILGGAKRLAVAVLWIVACLVLTWQRWGSYGYFSRGNVMMLGSKGQFGI